MMQNIQYKFADIEKFPSDKFNSLFSLFKMLYNLQIILLIRRKITLNPTAFINFQLKSTNAVKLKSQIEYIIKINNILIFCKTRGKYFISILCEVD